MTVKLHWESVRYYHGLVMGNWFADGLAALPLLQKENALPSSAAEGECVVLFRCLFALHVQ